MMGRTKLKTIRSEVRKAFNMSRAELLGWFNRQLGDLRQESKASQREMDTLLLLRDALIKESKPGARARKPSRMTGRAKN